MFVLSVFLPIFFTDSETQFAWLLPLLEGSDDLLRGNTVPLLTPLSVVVKMTTSRLRPVSPPSHAGTTIFLPEPSITISRKKGRLFEPLDVVRSKPHCSEW